MRQAAREAAPAASEPSPASASRRSDYQIERAAAGAALDGRAEPFPIGAAAALSGLHDFLMSVPALSERRRRFQAARRRSDRDILAQFDRHWLDPCRASRQPEHEHLQRTLVDALGIADLSRRWSETSG